MFDDDQIDALEQFYAELDALHALYGEEFVYLIKFFFLLCYHPLSPPFFFSG